MVIFQETPIYRLIKGKVKLYIDSILTLKVYLQDIFIWTGSDNDPQQFENIEN